MCRLLLALLLLHLPLNAFNVHKRFYTFSTEFKLEKDDVLFASAIKSSFKLRSQYDLYDVNGEFVAQGVHSFFPTYGLGWIYDWAANIDVYGRQGELVGSIDGKVYTGAKARFNFYNGDKELIAIALMNKECDAFTIVEPTDEKRVGCIKRCAVPFQVDYWNVALESEFLPCELVEIFAIFACDKQERFKP